MCETNFWSDRYNNVHTGSCPPLMIDYINSEEFEMLDLGTFLPTLWGAKIGNLNNAVLYLCYARYWLVGRR